MCKENRYSFLGKLIQINARGWGEIKSVRLVSGRAATNDNIINQFISLLFLRLNELSK